MRAVEIPGEFEAVQWTGNNLAEVAEVVGRYRGPEWQWTVQPDGSLYGSPGMDSLRLAEFEWFVVGPMWGGENPSDIPFKQLSPESYSNRYSETPNPD
ncbi:hypothetical protein [Lentzea sp. NPDC092896]|uniref:hypothetical protein n=1 Tax=Lentzea sp. NPDC092896 TaxID=3364127 RepID=UPI00382E3CAB